MRRIFLGLLLLPASGAWAQGPPPALPTLEERLFEAIDAGKELVAEGVMQRGRVDLDARNSNGETPLHRAVER